MTSPVRFNKLFMHRGVLLFWLITIAKGAVPVLPETPTVNGWFNSEGEVVIRSPFGLNRVDIDAAVILDDNCFMSGKSSGMIRTVVLSSRIDCLTMNFLDEKLGVVARKDISKTAGLISLAPDRVSWQRHVAGSGEGGTGESTAVLTATCDESGNLVLDEVSHYVVRHFFGLKKEEGEIHGRYLFHRLKSNKQTPGLEDVLRKSKN